MYRDTPEFRRFLETPRVSLDDKKAVIRKEGRVRASVTLAHPADAELRQQIGRELSELFEREVIATYKEDADLLGGIVIRVGDRVMDGSVRRRLRDLKHTLREPHAV